jgi:hypothetical protein
LTAKGNYLTYRFSQNDDPQRGFGSYTYIYNLQQILKITVSPAGTGTVAGNSLIVSPSSFSSNAVQSTLFTQQFNASGGVGTYTWAASAGVISSGGLWSYTPPAPGILPVTITATDSNGTSGTIIPTLNISAAGGSDGGSALTLSSALLPSGQVGIAGYSATITGYNGVPPYIWSMTNGNLPQGLTGTAGNTTYTITGTPQILESQTFTMEITDQSGQAPVSRVYTITIAQNVPVITTSSLPSGTAGSSYSSTSLAATGGTSPYTYNITLGTLPSGLTMTSGGLISGTPTSDGTYNFSVAASDSGTPKQVSVDKQLSITVAGVSTPTLTVSGIPTSVTTSTPFTITIANGPANGAVTYDDLTSGYTSGAQILNSSGGGSWSLALGNPLGSHSIRLTFSDGTLKYYSITGT